MNLRLAESTGMNIFQYKLLSFVLSAVILGLIGSFYAHYETYIVGDTFGMWVNIYAQVYAILGGVGFAVLGPIVGSALMTIVPEALRLSNLLAYVFNGVILILLILFLPEGVLSLSKIRIPFKNLKHNIFKKSEASKSAISKGEGESK